MTGITYNFLPFMALPLYVSLEQIDERLIEAAEDLYASKLKAFLRVTLPLSLPGIVAGTLLTFIPAAGDFINAQLLGSPQNHMIGNVIQSKFLELTDYPAAAAMSFILMAGILVCVFVYARAVGTEQLTGRRYERRRGRRRAAPSVLAAAWAFVQAPRPDALLDPLLRLPAAADRDRDRRSRSTIRPGKFNYTWQGFTWDNWRYWDGVPGIRSAIVLSLEIALLASLVATVLGTLIALALVRYGFRGRARRTS